MSSRTTTSVVTFLYPFVLAGHPDELPAGDYEVLAEDEAILTQSVTAYRRVSTFLVTNRHAGRSELLPVDQQDLELALEQDQADTPIRATQNSEAALSPSKDRK